MGWGPDCTLVPRPGDIAGFTLSYSGLRPRSETGKMPLRKYTLANQSYEMSDHKSQKQANVHSIYR